MKVYNVLTNFRVRVPPGNRSRSIIRCMQGMCACPSGEVSCCIIHSEAKPLTRRIRSAAISKSTHHGRKIGNFRHNSRQDQLPPVLCCDCGMHHRFRQLSLYSGCACHPRHPPIIFVPVPEKFCTSRIDRRLEWYSNIHHRQTAGQLRMHIPRKASWNLATSTPSPRPPSQKRECRVWRCPV